MVAQFLRWMGWEERTGWDWLELLVVPFVLSGGAYWIDQQASTRDEFLAEERYQQEILRGYLDQISILLIDKNLAAADLYTPVWNVAQTQTVLLLRELNTERRNTVMIFLKSTGLATPLPGSANYGNALSGGVLQGAGLENIDLSDAGMNAFDLRWTRLNRANLNHAFLGYSNLSNADLSDANLNQADLRYTTLDQTNFDNASLTNAIFIHTNLAETINLTNDQLATAQLCNVNGLDGQEIDRDCQALSQTFPDLDPALNWDQIPAPIDGGGA